jgi:DNA-binding CsgD family transcriptional regulator
MLNFSEGFPIIPETPTAGPLKLNAYAPGQVLAAYAGDKLEFLDPSRLTDPLSYTQYYALTQALGAMEGNLTGVSDGILGIANDPTKGATWRQFIGKAPLTPLRYGDSELTKEAIDADLKSLNMMLEAEEGVDVSTLSYDQLSDRQKQIRDLTAKIAYSEAQNKATEKLGFDWLDQMMAQDIFGLTGYFADQELAGDTKDIEKVLNREDPNFDSRSWFNGKFSDEVVSQYLLENGITHDFIADSPNADHAMMRVMAQLNTTDMQRRLSTYNPTTGDKLRLLRDTFVGGMINSPDTIPSATAELTLMGVSALIGTLGGPVGTVGGAVAGGVAASAATTALGGTSLFLRLKRAYDAASFTGRALRATAYTTETLYKLPLGIMPSYVANFGLIRGAAASFTFGAVQGGLSEYARQKREIAFGAATLYANPNAMTDYNASMMATTALESGALFGGVFGLGGGLLRSGVGAVNNRLSGVLIDPKTGFRNIEDKRFTLESTPLGNSIDNIRGVFNRKERALIDAPVVEKATMESVIENTEVTPEKLAADTEARVDRVETREAARSPDAARATPEDAGTRRYEDETVPDYVARVAPNRAVRNIFEAMTEFARRTTKQGNERFIEAGEQFDQMSIQDQMRVLFNGKKMLEDAKKAETEAVGLPRERERVYEELEKSRSAWFSRLKKKLTKEEFKAIKAEFEQGKKKSTRNLPELLKEARNTAKPAAERKADSDELSVRLLEAARSAATSPDREAAIKPEVPVEVLDTFDAAVIEHKLTGNISEETADTLKRSIAGEAPPKVSRVSRSFKEAQKAIIAAKLDKDRVRKIKAIVKDPEKFVDLVEGNRDNALKFFNYVNELVDNDMISATDRDLLLASVVHLNFNSKAFNVRFIVDSITGKDGNVDPSVIGQFSAKNNVIVMNRGFRGTAAAIKTRRAKALLHELGHAYFEHETSGSNYLQALRLYNQSVLANTTELIQLRPETPDPLLNTEFLDGYHLQNVEEVFVETFSKILFTEAEAAISTLTPMQTSRLQSVLDKIATSVTLAAAMFDNSTHYKIAKEIIDSITDIESKTNTFVSMPKLAGAYAKLHKLLDTVENAADYNKAIDEALEGNDATPFHLTQAEVNIFRNTKKDPGFIIALSIMKADKRTFVDANGNLTKGVVDLVNAYKDYKQAQFTSLQVKIANLIGTKAYSTLIGFDKFERLDIIKNELFSINSVEYRVPFIGKKGKPLVKAAPIIPALYEDRDLRSLDTMDYLDPTGSSIPYAVGFLGTNGNVLIEALASTRSSGKGLTPSSLSDIEADALIGVLRQDTALNTSLIDKLRSYLDNVGLPELSDMVVEVHHKAFIDNMKEEGVFLVSDNVVETPEFTTWFGNSKAINKKGKPLIVYHGSPSTTITEFKPNALGLIFFSESASFASDYTGGIGTVYSTFIRAENPFDYRNPDHLALIEDAFKAGKLSISDFLNKKIKEADKDYEIEQALNSISTGYWEDLENKVLIDFIKTNNFDSMRVKEVGLTGKDSGRDVNNWVVFNPNQVKSTDNRGTFNLTDADIRKQVSQEDTTAPQWPNKDVANTALGLMLKEKLTLEQIQVLLKSNLSSSMYSYLVKSYKTPKKLVGAVSKLLEEDGLVLNEDTQTWGIKLTKSKKGAIAEAQKVAVTFETTVLTKDNLVDIVSQIIKKASRGETTDNFFTGAASSMIMPRPDPKVVGKNAFPGNLELVLSKIEDGSLKTARDLIGYIHTTAANMKKPKKTKTEGLVTEQGTVKEGVKAPRITAADRITTTNKETRATIFSDIIEYNTATNGRMLTEQEIKLVGTFMTSNSMEEAAAQLKVSTRTAGNYRTKLLEKITDIFEQTAVKMDSSKDEIVTALNKHFDTVEAKVNKAKPSEPADVLKKVTEKKPKPEKSPVDAGALMAQSAAIAEKLKNKNPAPVPVPVPKDTEAVVYRVTDEVTGNAPDPVLRPAEQADAIIQGSSTASKEAVQFTPKRGLKMEVESSTELSKQPEKLAKTMRMADRLGMDALVFKDGSIIPVKVEDVKPVGETVIKKEPDAEPTVEITVDQKKPVLSVIPKEQKPQPKKQDFPVKVEKKKAPNKKPQPTVESKTVEPSTPRIPLPPKKEVPVEKTESEVVKTPEADRVERKVNEDPKLLRQSGMDVGFLKNFLKKYWESKIEADGGETMTPLFKQMWSHFVNVNQFIADTNKRILGDDIMDKFWAAVDRIKADELRLKVTEGPGSAKKLKSYRQILEQAAKEVAVEGKPDFVIPMLPDEVKFIKTDEAGNYRMSARSKKTKTIIDAAGEDPVIAGPPKPDAVLRDVADAPAEDTPVAVEAEPPTPKETVIGKGINQSEAGASRLMRLNNLVGWIFGGNQREGRSWWENLMNKGANASQSATGLGNTLRSTVDSLAFVSRFFDDTKTQTGHLVGAGKTAFKTAMQLRAEEGRLMTRIFREYAKMHNIVPRMTNTTKAALDMYVYESLFLNRQPNKADLVALGIPAYKAEEVVKQAAMVIKAARIANRNILDLENQTGRMSIVDENGNPVSSDTYAPVQLDHEGLARLDQGARSKLIAAMVQARTNRKLKDPTLDINTMIAMGWLDVAYNEDAKTLSIFTPDRVFKHAEMANMFSNETLQKLFVADMAKEGITGNKADIVRLLRKNQQEKFFVLETDTKYMVYRVPEKVTDLAPADKAKYMEAVNGNTAMYTERWRTKLNGKNLIEVEMKEMLKFKTKQYPYNNPDDFNSITKQPFFKIDPDGKTILPIKGLTPEEMLSSPETKAVLRTNMAESYFYFLKGRYFELAFQKELDRMFGQTGITILDVFDYVEKTGYENFDTIAAAMNWTPQELSNAQKGLAEGLKRLREEYQFNADTLPYLNSEVGHSARIGLAAIRFKFSAGYGISAITETLSELAKQSPEFYMIPVNIVKALRYVLADYRFSKRRLLESDIGDMTFVLENFRTDLANRFMGEIGYGSFKSDSRLDTKIASTMSNIRDAQGGLETATRTFEEAGKWMQSIGSLQSVTNGTRALAKQRIQRMIWKYVSKGKIETLFDALEETATAAELAELKKAAATDARAEAKLWKKFASVARHQAKFGDPNEAALFLKYGLTTKEQIRHLKWVMEKAGHKDGRVNILNLMDIHEDLRDNPVDGINPDILESAISAYAFMVEDLIIKTSTSELKGLSKLTGLDSRSAFGRLWYALTSWVRSYQDNVIMDYGSRSTIKYIASGIFLYAAMDTMIGLFKEWLAGRETEDMVKELEEQPGQYVLRGVSRVPFLGIANGLIEAGVSTVAGMTGGTYKYYGIPLMPAGAGAGMGAIETDYRNIQKIVEDPISARSLKATSDLFGVTSLVNRSPVAIPVRMLEDMNTFKEMDAIQRYLDMVQRDPYPYSKKANSKFKPIELDYTTTPRNYALEQKQATEAMQREMAMRPTMQRPESRNTFPMVEDQKGVSGRLGELLE